MDPQSTATALIWLRPDGVGTIHFEAGPQWQAIVIYTGLEPLAGMTTRLSPAFLDIPDAKSVYRTVQELSGAT